MKSIFLIYKYYVFHILKNFNGIPTFILYLDPYVKLIVYCDGSRVEKGSTRVKRKVSCPIYNEKFNFDLSNDQILHTSIVLKVINNVNSSCVGTAVIGYESSGHCKEHWLSMMKFLSKHVDAWYNLYY